MLSGSGGQVPCAGAGRVYFTGISFIFAKPYICKHLVHKKVKRTVRFRDTFSYSTLSPHVGRVSNV